MSAEHRSKFAALHDNNVWVKNSSVRRKTSNKQTNNQTNKQSIKQTNADDAILCRVIARCKIRLKNDGYI